jgi:hypothetical protein
MTALEPRALVEERFGGDGTETYRHLEDREEIVWGLNFVQLLYVALGAFAAIVFALYVSPLPPGPTLFVAVLLGGLPVVLSIIATRGDVAPWTMARAAWRWASGPKRFAPGGSQVEAGYVVERAVRARADRGDPPRGSQRLEEVWDL